MFCDLKNKKEQEILILWQEFKKSQEPWLAPAFRSGAHSLDQLVWPWLWEAVIGLAWVTWPPQGGEGAVCALKILAWKKGWADRNSSHSYQVSGSLH